MQRTGKDLRKGDMLVRCKDGKDIYPIVNRVEPVNKHQVGVWTNMGLITLYALGVYDVVVE